MGLDTSHGCWSGAYSAFMRWRTMVAKVAGLPPIQLMEGYWPGVICYGDDVLDSRKPGQSLLRGVLQELPIRWECLKPDPLHVLLMHSDCDGIIEHKDCKPIAERLKELIPRMPAGGGGGHIDNWLRVTQQFVDGLLEAHDGGSDVEFY